MADPVVESVAEAAPGFVSSITINKPTGTVSGDVLVAIIGKANFGRTTTGPEGWTEYADSQHPSGFDGPGVAFYTLVAGSSEPGSYTFTFNSGQNAVGTILRVSGADATPRASAVSTQNVIDQAPISPTVTATSGDLLLSAFGFGRNDGLPATPPSGMTLVQDVENASAITMGVASEALASTGATGTRTWALSAGGGGRWAAVSIAIAPAAGGGGDTDELTADDIESASEVSSPAIGQVHALLANDVASASEVSAPSLGQVHALTADDVESASEVSSPALDAEGEEPEPEPEPEEEPRREVSWPWRPNRYAVEREEEARRYQEARKAEEAAERALEARRKALARAEKAVTRIERGLLASEPSVSPPPDRLAALAKARERVKAAEQALRRAEQSMTEARIRAEDEEIALLLLLAA